MLTKVLDSGSSNRVPIVSGNHKRCQLDNAGWRKPVKLKMRDDVGEDLIRLLRKGRWGGSIGSNPDLAGYEDEIRAGRHGHGVAVQSSGRVHVWWIQVFDSHWPTSNNGGVSDAATTSRDAQGLSSPRSIVRPQIARTLASQGTPAPRDGTSTPWPIPWHVRLRVALDRSQ